MQTAPDKLLCKQMKRQKNYDGSRKSTHMKSKLRTENTCTNEVKRLGQAMSTENVEREVAIWKKESRILSL